VDQKNLRGNSGEPVADALRWL